MGQARVIRPDRAQLRLEVVDLESLVAEDHQARTVWAFVEKMTLDGFYAARLVRVG